MASPPTESLTPFTGSSRMTRLAEAPAAAVPVARTGATAKAGRRPPRKRPPRTVPRGYETVKSILLTEPRIEAIRAELAALLNLVELEVDGQPVEVDGFRLRDVSQWADYPTSLSDIFWHLSSVCNFYCDFCYEKGNPPDFPIQNLPRMATEQEVATRLRHYDPVSRRGVFTVRTSINEPFANKRALEVLRAMRKRCPDEPISFVTNGSYLNDSMVQAFSELGPLFFNLSLYSTDPEIRRQVLRDGHPERAVEAVNLLARHRVPFMTNLVMWPLIPLEDMERTIAFLSERRASVIRVCLGGYSRYMEMEAEAFAADEYWPTVVEAVERLRDNYAVPILIEPNAYVRTDTEASLDGVVIDSPAAQAGLRRGDLILDVDGRPVRTRTQLMSALRASGRAESQYRPPGVSAAPDTAEQGRGETVELTYRRGSEEGSVRLSRYEPGAMATYPYGEIASSNDFAFGIILTDCLRYSSLRAAEAIIAKEGAKRPLILTSALIEPMLQEMIARSGAFATSDVQIKVAQNHYFGGSINIGDLLVVSDFVAAIAEHRAAGGEADLVLIPESAFASSPWGRDLTGRPWTNIERISEVAVRRVPCPTITI